MSSGGDGTPLQYKLNPGGSYQSDNHFTVGAGSYAVTVKDPENFTTTTSSLTVGQPSTLTAVVANKNPHLYYGYSGDQTDTITVTPSGGTGPYTVSVTINRNIICNYINDAGDEVWKASGGTTINNVCGSISSHPVSTATISSGNYSVYATLLDTAIYTVTITDAHGCTYVKTDSVFAEDVRCFAGNSKIAKIQICHQTGSSKNPCVSICIDSSALAEHLAHGDALGICPKNGCGTSYNNSSPVIAETFDPASKLKVKVLPNPSESGVPYVLTTNGKAGQQVEIRVLNAFGKTVYLTKGAANETFRFGANFISGFYIVQVIQNNQVQTIKLIKE